MCRQTTIFFKFTPGYRGKIKLTLHEKINIRAGIIYDYHRIEFNKDIYKKRPMRFHYMAHHKIGPYSKTANA